jgi:hypothetical protein
VPRENALNCSGGGGSELGSVLHGIAEFGEAQDNFDTFGSMCEAVYEGRVDEERDAWRGGSSSEYGSDTDEAALEAVMLPNTSSSDFADFGGGGSSTSASSPERAFGSSDSDERAFSSDSDEPEINQVFWSESAGFLEFEDQEEPALAAAAAAAAAATMGRLHAAGDAEVGRRFDERLIVHPDTAPARRQGAGRRQIRADVARERGRRPSRGRSPKVALAGRLAGGRWGPAELAKLAELTAGRTDVAERQDTIAAQLGTGRTGIAVYRQYLGMSHVERNERVENPAHRGGWASAAATDATTKVRLPSSAR